VGQEQQNEHSKRGCNTRWLHRIYDADYKGEDVNNKAAKKSFPFVQMIE